MGARLSPRLIKDAPHQSSGSLCTSETHLSFALGMLGEARHLGLEPGDGAAGLGRLEEKEGDRGLSIITTVQSRIPPTP